MRHLKTVTTTEIESISSDQSDSSTKTQYQEKLAWNDYLYTKIEFSECKLGTANMPFLDPNNIQHVEIFNEVGLKNYLCPTIQTNELSLQGSNWHDLKNQRFEIGFVRCRNST